MLSLGKFPTQIQYNTLLHNPITQSLQFPSKPFFIRPNFPAVRRIRLYFNALKTQTNGGFNLKETEVSDEFEDEFDDEFLDLEDDGEIEDDDEEVFVPLENMKKWQENRPRGFGEGKEYDTSIEDKLMEEIEQSRKAQLANINKLKNSPLKTTSQKETVKKGPTISPDGIRVRLVNLPKKKNIHKDLRVAFKEVPGIVNIVPVVSGNEKTRDPICKGLAFVDFKNHDDAQRFIQSFSGKSISFGKVQKQIKCEMTNSNSDKGLDVGIVKNVPLLDSLEESVISEDDEDDDEEDHYDEGEINEISTTLDPKLVEELKMEVGEEPAIDSSSSNRTKKVKKVRTNGKKAASKGRNDKSPKLNIPGSANKLKIRDKAILSDVFSKYGAMASSTVKEPSR